MQFLFLKVFNVINSLFSKKPSFLSTLVNTHISSLVGHVSFPVLRVGGVFGGAESESKVVIVRHEQVDRVTRNVNVRRVAVAVVGEANVVNVANVKNWPLQTGYIVNQLKFVFFILHIMLKFRNLKTPFLKNLKISNNQSFKV